METNYTWEKLFECMHMFASSGSIQDGSPGYMVIRESY